MRKKIRLTEADVRRLVQKVIEEQCGSKTATLGFAELGGPGMGFNSPMESRYEIEEQDDPEAVDVDDEEVEDEEVEDENTEETEETKPGITGGSSKFSDKDVTDVKLFKDGKKQFNQLTINQKGLAKLLGFSK